MYVCMNLCIYVHVYRVCALVAAMRCLWAHSSIRSMNQSNSVASTAATAKQVQQIFINVSPYVCWYIAYLNICSIITASLYIYVYAHICTYKYVCICNSDKCCVYQMCNTLKDCDDMHYYYYFC